MLKFVGDGEGRVVRGYVRSHPTIAEGAAGQGAGRGPPPPVALGMTIVNLFACCRLQFLIAFCVHGNSGELPFYYFYSHLLYSF